MNSIGDEIVRNVEIRHLRGGGARVGRDSCCHHKAVSKDLDVMVTSEVYLQERICSFSILGYLLM